MAKKVVGPITARCMYCTAWVCDQLPDEHSHTLKIDYDNTCDTITLCMDGKVLFNIDLAQWQLIHKQLSRFI